MKKVLSAVVAAVITVAVFGQAFADSSHDTTVTGGTTVSQSQSAIGTGGAGGAGGQGGQGGKGGDGGNAAVIGSGNSSNKNENKNSNTQGQGQQQGQGQKQGQAQGQGQSQTGVNAQGQNNGQAISYKNEVNAYASAPTMGVASLVAAPETCMGSVSTSLSGGNGIVGAGIGFGKTYESENCNRRMNARYLMSLGLPQAALLLLAQDENVAKALTQAGVTLPGAKAAAIVAPTTAAQEARISDREAARREFEKSQVQGQ